MPTVSIVLPSYNGSKYIREAINSIQEQTYSDWELIIVDDCSEDNTLEIAREYEEKDNRIRVIHNEINRKLPGALNIGFEHAEGRYFTWTSDDNMYLPNALAVMAGRMDSSDAPMVCADMYAIDEEGKLKWNAALSYRDEIQCWKNTLGACFLYRREVYYNVGNYDTGLYGVEDYDYWLRIKKRYGKIERIDQILYKYRFHESSLTFKKKEMIWRALTQMRKKHLDFILNDFKNRKEFLYSFYYEMLENQTIDGEIREKIQSFFPELKNDALGERGKYIIFGAGGYGTRAANVLKEKVYYFADNDPEKIGTYKNGKEVLSFAKMMSMAGQYDIIVAIRSEYIYQLIHQLLAHDMDQYCTWQTYMYEHLLSSAYE